MSISIETVSRLGPPAENGMKCGQLVTFSPIVLPWTPPIPTANRDAASELLACAIASAMIEAMDLGPQYVVRAQTGYISTPAVNVPGLGQLQTLQILLPGAVNTTADVLEARKALWNTIYETHLAYSATLGKFSAERPGGWPFMGPWPSWAQALHSRWTV